MLLFFEDLDDGLPRGPSVSEEVDGTVEIMRAEDDVDVTSSIDDGITVLLGKAACDRDLEVWVGRLQRFEFAQMPIEPVVCVLTDAACVHHDDVGTLDVVDALHAVGFEQTGYPLGIVLVHLTAECLYVVAPCHSWIVPSEIRPIAS